MQNNAHTVEDGAASFLFLTYGEVNNPHAWDEFFQGVPRGQYSILVHAKHPNEVKHPRFRKRCIEPVATKWGTTSLVRAHKRLLEKALENPNNQRFILVSDSCMPVVGLQTMLDRLKNSFVDGRTGRALSAFDVHEWQKTDQRKNLLHFAREALAEARCDGTMSRKAVEVLEWLVQSKAKGVTSHTQWCILNRRDARIIAEGGEEMEAWLEAYDRMLTLERVRGAETLAPDELFVLSFLQWHRERRNRRYEFLTQARTTFGHCCLLFGGGCGCNTQHPHPLPSLHGEFIAQCNHHSSLFGRKFREGMDVFFWRLLWAARSNAERVEAANRAYRFYEFEEEQRSGQLVWRTPRHEEQILADWAAVEAERDRRRPPPAPPIAVAPPAGEVATGGEQGATVGGEGAAVAAAVGGQVSCHACRTEEEQHAASQAPTRSPSPERGGSPSVGKKPKAAGGGASGKEGGLVRVRGALRVLAGAKRLPRKEVLGKVFEYARERGLFEVDEDGEWDYVVLDDVLGGIVDAREGARMRVRKLLKRITKQMEVPDSSAPIVAAIQRVAAL